MVDNNFKHDAVDHCCSVHCINHTETLTVPWRSMFVSTTPCPSCRYSFRKPSLTWLDVANRRPSSLVLKLTEISLVCVTIIGSMLTRVYAFPSYANIAATKHIRHIYWCDDRIMYSVLGEAKNVTLQQTAISPQRLNIYKVRYTLVTVSVQF